MKLLIIRHGDPDYEIDSLTAGGWAEAELLADRLCKEKIDAFYVSPLGRARDTAGCTLKRLGREAEVLDWLREFPPRIEKPGGGSADCAWDWLPAVWTADPRYFDKDAWCQTEVMRAAHVGEAYDAVCAGLDALLARRGYRRDGMIYRAEHPNKDTVALFCHFGVECVMLSHLMHVSPMILWHGLCAAPSSVTAAVTEERRSGIAAFRVNAFGDTGHLYAGGRVPSFAARFCEIYTDEGQRHD